MRAEELGRQVREMKGERMAFSDRFCPSCSHPNQQEARICAGCGTDLSADQSTEQPQHGEAEQRYHSRAGIASTVVSVVVLLFIGICFVASVYANWATGLALYMFSNVVGALVSLWALILGATGLSERHKKRFFSVLGTVLSAATLVGIVVVWALLIG